MGWFLPIRKRKPAIRRRPAVRAPKAWDPNRTLAGLEALGAVALFFAVLLAWHFSEGYLIGYVHRRQLPRIGPKEVELDQVPPWMSASVQLDIRTLVAGHVTPDVLDNASLERTLGALALSPWVQRVQRVQRLPGDHVRVLATYREPVAAVVTASSLRLVDINGICLPGVYAADRAGTLGLPSILGVAEPAPLDGEHWQGEDLHAGLGLIRSLRSEPYFPQVVALDAGERDARGRISLVIQTKSGRIIWGLPPGQEKAIEADASVKLARLTEVYRAYRTIDPGGDLDLYQVDAFSLAPRVHEPMAQDHSLTLGYTWSR